MDIWAKLFSKLDKTGKGTITFEAFQTLPVDEDGKITQEALKDMLKDMLKMDTPDGDDVIVDHMMAHVLPFQKQLSRRLSQNTLNDCYKHYSGGNLAGLAGDDDEDQD